MRRTALVLASTALAVLLTGGAALVGAETPVQAAFSEDKGKIAFVSNRDGNSEVYTMNADGSNVTRLTHTPAPERYPAWSPDGAKIAFVSDRDGYSPDIGEGDSEIYVMTPDGSSVTRLTDSPGWDDQPTWSPDGTQIAFSSTRGGINKIYKMNADGSNVTLVTKNEWTGATPSWSPDGTRIAFQNLSSSDTNNDIYTIDPDGSNPTNLTNTPQLPEAMPA